MIRQECNGSHLFPEVAPVPEGLYRLLTKNISFVKLPRMYTIAIHYMQINMIS